MDSDNDHTSISSLMSELYGDFKNNVKRQGSKVFQVSLSDYSISPVDLNNMYHSHEIKDKGINTVYDLIHSVDFIDVLPFISEMEKNYNNSFDKFPEILIFKDAFDFLRDQEPKSDKKAQLQFLLNEQGTFPYFSLQYDLHNWNELNAMIIDSKVIKEFPNAKIVAKILYELIWHSHMSQSIYAAQIFKPGSMKVYKDEKHWIQISVEGEWFLKDSRPIIRYLIKPIFGWFLKRHFKRITNLIYFQQQSFLTQPQIKNLPYGLLERIKKTQSSGFDKLRHIRSHYNQKKSVEYLMHLISQYDNKPYSVKNEQYLFLTYSKEEDLEITDFLKEHFNTDKIFTFKSDTGDMRISIWQP